MSLQWIEPEEFLRHKGIRIFHAYKDEFSDIPLEFWYSTSSTAEPGSPCEFDVRELEDYRPQNDTGGKSEHKRVIKAAIDIGLLQSDTPVLLKRNA
ncbi:MAG: hypothetical protein JW947_07150 [Sedimentisphaerales bacterium]|nr:hypothetical protein [Sedimentisphaerales bacterium]